MNSADTPGIMQFAALGFAEQKGRAATDQQGEPFAREQLRMAEVFRSWRKLHP
jgi:hypothetical protein